MKTCKICNETKDVPLFFGEKICGSCYEKMITETRNVSRNREMMNKPNFEELKWEVSRMWIVLTKHDGGISFDVCHTREQALEQYQDTIRFLQQAGADARVWLTSVVEFQDVFFQDHGE